MTPQFLAPHRHRWIAVVMALAAASSCSQEGHQAKKQPEEIRITGSGSTFIYPLMGAWMKAYRTTHPQITFWYDPVGSGKGARQTLAGTVDFGASDGPVGDAALHGANVKVVQIPVTLGAVVPAYNLPSITGEIRFTGTALAEIYLGKIRKWNDPQIARANPRLALPNHDIDVLFRLDDSGTTYVWTDYLSKIDSEWNERVGRGTHVTFPTGSGANFNEGVVELIKQTPYALGYLQLTYAIQNHVPYGRVQNAAGAFVKAESASITAASAATASEMPDDFRVSITNAADADAFPISSFTWLLIPDGIADPAKKNAIMGFLRWILSDGQDMATPLHYAPLPADVARKVQHAIDRIQ
jgi:phosphate transport system substrate-binding protein